MKKRHVFVFGAGTGFLNVPNWRDAERNEALEPGQTEEDWEEYDGCWLMYLTEAEWDKLNTDGWIELIGPGWKFEAEARY